MSDDFERRAREDLAHPERLRVVGRAPLPVASPPVAVRATFRVLPRLPGASMKTLVARALRGGRKAASARRRILDASRWRFDLVRTEV